MNEEVKEGRIDFFSSHTVQVLKSEGKERGRTEIVYRCRVPLLKLKL